MPNKASPTAADFIMPLNMNGLQGRMLRMPPPAGKKREMLLLYGHHALLERWWLLAETLNAYGGVTMPDLPGFGGMDSFYKIGKKPSIDNYADYLAAYIKLRFKSRRVTILGISFGFVVATRMLQRYPELAKKVDLLVSLVGFTHKEDLVFKPPMRMFIGLTSKFLSTRPCAFVIRYGFLNGPVIRGLYRRLSRPQKRFAQADPTEFDATIEYDIQIWHANDVRTHWATTSEFMWLDNCRVRVGLPVWHVCNLEDYYFNYNIVEQHMRVVFSDYHQSTIDTGAHTPSIIAGKKEMAAFIPPKLRRVLARQPR